MSRLPAALVICALAGACGPGEGPPLNISDVAISRLSSKA
jgi:hypothetical protein